MKKGIYLKAAKIVDARPIGACYAIARACDWDYRMVHVVPFKLLMGPVENTVDQPSYWWSHPIECNKVLHNARVMGLLFIHEMERTGDL